MKNNRTFTPIGITAFVVGIIFLFTSIFIAKSSTALLKQGDTTLTQCNDQVTRQKTIISLYPQVLCEAYYQTSCDKNGNLIGTPSAQINVITQ